jgi:hypothetical protein
MTCCTSDTTPEYPRSAVCPQNGERYSSVTRKTLLQHVRSPRNQHLAEQAWYFCSDADCDVVYFSEQGLLVTRGEVRQEVGQKSQGQQRTLCYCFDVTEKRVNDEIWEHSYSPSYEFIVAQTRASNCACEAQNPSGRCCLKDFPKAARSRLTRQ